MRQKRKNRLRKVAQVRKVEYCKKGFYNSTDEKTKASDFSTGFCHGFFSEGNVDEGLEVYMLVEIEDGTLFCIQTHKVKFLNPPTEETKVEKFTSTNTIKAEIAAIVERRDNAVKMGYLDNGLENKLWDEFRQLSAVD